jgi:cytochrome P450
MNEVTSEAIDQMLVSKDGKPTVHNIEHFFASVALRVFMMFSIGTDYRNNAAREKELCHAVSQGSWAVGRVISLGLPMWNIIPWVKLISTARETVLNDFRKIVHERRGKMSRGEVPELDDCLTAMINENLEEKDMADHFVTLICAGHDTTAYFSSYMCLLLAQNPAAQDKLYEEITSAMQGRDEVTADDVVELKYMQKVMQETLRLYSIIPQVTRVSAEEVHIKEANVTIPKGVNVMIPMFLINRDPEIWENPSEFIPERFDGKSNVDFTSAKNGFFPFGYGSRTCIGNTLAQIESAIFMCKLLKKFRFEPDTGFRPSILSGISLTTSNGINVVLRER